MVYKMNATGQYSTWYTSPGEVDGDTPVSGFISDSAGDLYGTTEHGGPGNCGTIYKLDPAGTETIL